MKYYSGFLTILSAVDDILNKTDDPQAREAAFNIQSLCVLELARSGFPHVVSLGEVCIEDGRSYSAFMGDTQKTTQNGVSRNGTQQVASIPPADHLTATETTVDHSSADKINGAEMNNVQDANQSDAPDPLIVHDADESDALERKTTHGNDEDDFTSSVGDIDWDAGQTIAEQEQSDDRFNFGAMREKIESQTSMYLYDFTMTSHHVRIKNQGDTNTGELITFPLYPEIGSSRIVVCTKYKGKADVFRSDHGGIVEVSLGPAELVIEANFDNGYNVNIEQTGYNIDDGVEVEVDTQTYGNKGHVVQKERDVIVHIVPATRHNKNGKANFITYIDWADGSSFFGTTSESQEQMFQYGDDTMNISCSWNDETEIFYSGIDKVS